MKRTSPITSFLVGHCLLGLLASCNDVSTNYRKGTIDNATPAIGTPEAPVSIISYSGLHRDRGANVLTTAEETQHLLNNTLPSTYRTIPSMEKDDEGSTSNVITVSSQGRPGNSCGVANSSLNVSARIADCAQKNGTLASWNGTINGAAGEGSWSLVSRDDSGHEIWLDSRTNLVWSDVMVDAAGGNVFNWCKASGNTESNSATLTIDCNTLNAGENVCIGASTAGIGDQIEWRLPTRNDFLQADLNGSRSVFKKETSVGLWTATMVAAVAGRTQAWVYSTANGTLQPGDLNTNRQVRCIGTPRLQ